MIFRKKRAQSIGEYIMLVSIVVIYGVAVYPMIKRSSQSLIKASADAIGRQTGAEQNFESDSGYVIGSNTLATSWLAHDTDAWPGTTQYVTDERTDSITNTYSNGGYTVEK